MTDATPDPATPNPVTPATSRGPSTLTWIVSLVLAALVGALLFLGGFLAAGSTGSATCAAPDEAFEAFCQAYEKLKQQFVDDLDDAQLAEGAIQGMFEYGVRDPFSGYMGPDDFQRAREDLSGQFSGIGAEMGVRNLDDPADPEACQTFGETCVLVVVAPLEDTPAQRAGLQPGDFVLAIDAESVEGKDLGEAVELVRGETGTDVTLTLRRGDETLDLTITRAEIQIREVTSELLDDGVGYVALHGFSDAAAEQFRRAIRVLLEDGATSFVFDLRNNPGGYIEAARKIASEFIDEGTIFIQESAGDDVKAWESTGEGQATDTSLPVVVLVNEGSASASEIVAAALKERDRATIVGQPTYGKNTVQLWDRLDNGGGVRITISRWFTPNHNSVAGEGVQPDVVVEIPDGTPPERDLFLEAALDVLAGRQVGTDASAAPPPGSGEATDAPASPSALTWPRSPFSWDAAGQLESAA